mmetsp:Transcript_44198/g.94144  ORF Transcript_44198/g.94144 Transcript_44198/m.94144 type:complete len:216 (+) Transcript_44198:375-1022(+)
MVVGLHAQLAQEGCNLVGIVRSEVLLQGARRLALELPELGSDLGERAGETGENGRGRLSEAGRKQALGELREEFPAHDAANHTALKDAKERRGGLGHVDGNVLPRAKEFLEAPDQSRTVEHRSLVEPAEQLHSCQLSCTIALKAGADGQHRKFVSLRGTSGQKLTYPAGSLIGEEGDEVLRQDALYLLLELSQRPVRWQLASQLLVFAKRRSSTP